MNKQVTVKHHIIKLWRGRRVEVIGPSRNRPDFARVIFMDGSILHGKECAVEESGFGLLAEGKYQDGRIWNKDGVLEVI